jgi:hypothetical protein
LVCYYRKATHRTGCAWRPLDISALLAFPTEYLIKHYSM